MDIYVHVFTGRDTPSAQREAAALDAPQATGDCFPHLLLSQPDLVVPFHVAGGTPAGQGRSAGKRARLTRLRVVLRRTRERMARGHIIRTRAKLARFPQDDVQ